MRKFLVALVLATVALACSSNDDNGSSGSSGSSGSGGACVALTNLCARLPVAQVESACGTGYTKLTPIDTSGAGPVNACTYQKDVSTKTEHNISINYRCLDKVDGHQYFESLLTNITGGERLTGVADEAHFHTSAPPYQQATLHYRKGQRIITSSVNFPDPAPCTPEQAKAHLLAVSEKVFAMQP